MKTSHTPAPPVLLAFKQPTTFATEVDNLVKEGLINEDFGSSLKIIVQDHLTGIVRGRALKDDFVELAKKYVGPHGVIKIGSGFFQLLVMVKHTDNATKHRWKLIQLHNEGYHVKGLSEI